MIYFIAALVVFCVFVGLLVEWTSSEYNSSSPWRLVAKTGALMVLYFLGLALLIGAVFEVIS